MRLIHTVEDLIEAISIAKTEGKTLGFVPTMGALHQGHLALVKKSCSENNLTVVSIFVNPTQFNDPKDLEKYPRTPEQDIELLSEQTNVDLVFLPSIKEIYPESDIRQFDFGQLEKVMEGRFRPGHFNGVAQVVSRLFEIVQPDVAYFGEKDFQQLAIIREMVRQLQLPIRISGEPIVREASGLAMSSRNERLTEDQRLRAAAIYRCLKNSLLYMKNLSVLEIIAWVTKQIEAEQGFELEYFEIVDGNSLQPLSDWSETEYAVGCMAVFCGEVRLIDNLTYYNNTNR